MRILVLTLTLFSTLKCLSQQNNDSQDIVNFVIQNYSKDSIKVYHKFYNNRLIKDLESAEIDKSLKIFRFIEEKIQDSIYNGLNEDEKNDIRLDLLWNNLHADTVTIKFKKTKILLNQSLEIIDQKNNKRIKRQPRKSLTSKKVGKFIYLSYPLASKDRKTAFIYLGYYCGGLCGRGGILYLEKLNGAWQIVEYVPTWIA